MSRSLENEPKPPFHINGESLAVTKLINEVHAARVKAMTDKITKGGEEGFWSKTYGTPIIPHRYNPNYYGGRGGPFQKRLFSSEFFKDLEPVKSTAIPHS